VPDPSRPFIDHNGGRCLATTIFETLRPDGQDAYCTSMPESRDRITFNPMPRRVGGEWHLEAHFPSGLTVAIRGFKSEGEAKEWLGSTHRMTWVRERGYPDD
jgi:hypothetical protein